MPHDCYVLMAQSRHCLPWRESKAHIISGRFDATRNLKCSADRSCWPFSGLPAWIAALVVTAIAVYRAALALFGPPLGFMAG
jgi:hypothetical protein